MELFDVCDEYGTPTGEIVTRDEAHEKGICHRTAHVWIVRNVQGRYQVLLQKRSLLKDSFPGQLDTSSAGHIPAGEEPLISAVRELKEELGLSVPPEDLEYAGQFRIKYEKEFHGKMFRDNEVANLYVYMRDVPLEDITVQEEELDSVGWFDLKETFIKCRDKDPRYCVPMGGLYVLMDRLGVKVVFCDVDGVINNARTKDVSPNGYVGVSDNLIRQLKRIVDATGAKIVLSSDWRLIRDDQRLGRDYRYLARKLYMTAGLKLSDHTDDISWSRRGREIRKYVTDHPEITSFVILDDIPFSDFLSEGLENNLVQTNPKLGLTDQDVEKAIRILNEVQV